MILNDDTFLLYAMKHYGALSCPTLSEFENDLRVFVYIKKQLSKPDRNIRVLLNHIITCCNVFGEGATPMLFHRVDKEYWGALATFLLFLNRMPEIVPGTSVRVTDLILDDAVVQELRRI